MIGILGRFRLVSRGAFGDSVLVLQARQLSATVVVPRAVLVVVRQAPEARLMEDSILWDVARTALVEREADVLPPVDLKLPALDDREPL